MIWTKEAQEQIGEESAGRPTHDCALFARGQSEAIRYRVMLEEFGIEAEIGEATVAQALAVPIFVSADQRERAEEILSTLYIENAWDDDEDDEFEDEEDEEEDEEEFFPDDVDDFEEEEEEEEEEDLD